MKNKLFNSIKLIAINVQMNKKHQKNVKFTSDCNELFEKAFSSFYRKMFW